MSEVRDIRNVNRPTDSMTLLTSITNPNPNPNPIHPTNPIL